MRNLKKLLALIVAICVLATFTVPAFAADATLAADTKISADLGVLVGAGAGVTPEYGATTPTRIQAAVMLLRLTGNLTEAQAFVGEDNFADADKATWAKPLMGFLKANPQLGFVGDGTNFMPTETITAQQYYKVLLTALGYSIPADYAYADTLTFAKGTAKLALGGDVASFTVDALATATVEALKATVKGGTKALAATLVDAGKLDKVKAQAASLYYTPKALDVTSVAAITNARVDIALNTAAVQADLDAVAISAKDAAGVALEVKSATLSADGKTIKVVTAAQTAYAVYTITVGSVSKTFVGLPVDATAPTATAAVDSYITVKVTFNESVDEAAAENIANYTIDNSLVVLKAESDGTVVTLTTAPQVVGTIYKLVIKNVTDLSGNAVAETTQYFGGMAKDTSNLAVDAPSTVVDYNQYKLVFNKAVDPATATNVANYVIDNSLVVLKAEVDAADITGKTVLLTTSTQVVGTIYKLTTSNVTDKLGNGLAAADVRYFGGMAKDLSKPVAAVAVTDNDKVTVTFGPTKVDAATATNIANYVIDSSLTVLKAELGTDGKTVTLTTSAQTVGTIYKIVISNVTSINAVVMDSSTQYFGGVSKDTAGPTISTVTPAANKLTIVFSEKVNAATASIASNYAFDGGLGYPTKAVVDTILDATGKTVVLTTAAQTASKVYNVTITGVTDVNGNAITADGTVNKRSFVGQSAAVASVVKYVGATVVNSNTVDLIFDTDLTQATVDAGFTVAIDKVTTITNPSLAYKALVQENKKIVRVQFRDTAENPALFAQGTVYAATVSALANLEAISATNTNTKSFAGTNLANAVPEVKAVIPVDSTTLKVVFTEPVKGIVQGSFVSSNGVIGSVSVANTDVVTETLLYLNTATVQGTVYTLTVQSSNGITDAAGYVALKDDNGATTPVQLTYNFAGTNAAHAKPTVLAIVPVDAYNFDIVFSQAVPNATSVAYTVQNTTDNVAVDLSTATKTLSFDKTKVRVALKTPVTLIQGKVYTLTIPLGAVITDLAGFAMDTTVAVTKNFAGTNVANAVPTIAGVSANATRDVITVTFSEAVSGTFSASTLVLTAAGYVAATSYTSAVLQADGVTVIITLADPVTATQIASVAATASIVDVNGLAASTTAVQFGIQ